MKWKLLVERLGKNIFEGFWCLVWRVATFKRKTIWTMMEEVETLQFTSSSISSWKSSDKTLWRRNMSLFILFVILTIIFVKKYSLSEREGFPSLVFTNWIVSKVWSHWQLYVVNLSSPCSTKLYVDHILLILDKATISLG